jgi:hypothetical protein
LGTGRDRTKYTIQRMTSGMSSHIAWEERTSRLYRSRIQLEGGAAAGVGLSEWLTSMLCERDIRF